MSKPGKELPKRKKVHPQCTTNGLHTNGAHVDVAPMDRTSEETKMFILNTFRDNFASSRGDSALVLVTKLPELSK